MYVCLYVYVYMIYVYIRTFMSIVVPTVHGMSELMKCQQFLLLAVQMVEQSLGEAFGGVRILSFQITHELRPRDRRNRCHHRIVI